MLDPLDSKAKQAIACSFLHVDAKQHDVCAGDCMHRKWTALVVGSHNLKPSDECFRLLGLINSVELGSCRVSLIELPEQPIVIGSEFFQMAIPFLRKLPVQALKERQKRFLGRLCIFPIVHLDALPLEAVPVPREAEAIEEVLSTDERHVP